MSITVIGIDLGKSIFHLVAHDYHGQTVFRKKLSRQKLKEFLANHPQTTIAFEACGGAHWLGRYCQQSGHHALLIPPQYVRPYVKGNKNDFIDADAIAEASRRPSMRFVEIKSEQAQVISSIQRIRQGFIKDRTACMSRVGALLLEFGLSFRRGHAAMKRLFSWLAEQPVNLPPLILDQLQELHCYYSDLNERIKRQDRQLQQLVQSNHNACLLKTIPGVGDLTASLCIAEGGNARQFKNGRDLSAWLGLVPHQHSTGGKPRLLGISKRGNKHLRTLFIHGARSILSRPTQTGTVFGDWLVRLRAAKPFNVACVALANKLARIAWAVLRYQHPFNAAMLQSKSAWASD